MEKINREKTKTRSKISFWLIAVLLFSAFVDLGSGSESGTTTTNQTRSGTKMICLRDSSKSFWIRNACEDGFVVVDKNRVLVQNTPRGSNDESVGLIKEECRNHDLYPFGPESLNSTDPFIGPSSSVLSSPVKIRLFSPSAQKYICFSPNGRVRTVIQKRVKKRGDLCVFHEHPAPEDPTSSWADVPQARRRVNYQSTHNPEWYLGFSRTMHAKSRRSRGKRGRLPVLMSTTVLARSDQCEFQFSTGSYTPVPLEVQWKGLFARAREAFQTSSSSSSAISLLAVNSSRIEDVSVLKPTLGGVEQNLIRSSTNVHPSSISSVEPKKRRKRRKKLRNRSFAPNPTHQDSDSL